ncbi:MAG: BA14K family protein [Mesorhizobium sp.]|uniref:BA14K family protein n=1 Tax=Mesorhizobium sp. TaxID=1871066 RepID=UPI000FE79326|nr:BA14K family protein [Mesorhizobium sp.]RWM19496.1 MAG: BA14K family protein [Mesorhizobium sp.]TIP75018.1 MAG: BA14K family protein [Mesorhizobium sp.]TIQ09250.1 MAG: BA14K family protein [Mesorhizobium sp.]TIR50119.1 MAG: BA14K family protein [Mesorhizobium sp.]TJV95960.1 MAG: BA14K family protein [Mesorhizobium sp.]
MNRIMSGLLATALSASFAVAQIVPVNAQPIYVPLGQNVSSDVQTVEHRRWRRGFDRDFSRRDFRRDFSRRDFDRRDFRRFARNDDDFRYWRGYRGYRYYRPGYRRYNDFWFPLAAFATGALITSAIVNQPRRIYRGDAHVEWCYSRYRSYRAYDNTYQPYYGPRRQCISPY